ncbi:MAG: VWA domain-containing protein, partial [Phycisphaerae bacterium]|nr:VWA domain-containing protein [Phycisphaerae bacterium]
MLFEHPGWLMVLVLLAPAVWWSRGARVSLGPVRGVVVPVLRCVLIIALVLALAEPVILRSNDDLTVAVVLDRSRSIMPTELDAAVDWVQQATVGRGESDRLAVVHAARDASVVMMPDANGQIGIEVVQGRTDASDLAGGVEYAKGLLPDAGAHRILLVSDGNQTAGSLLEAASRAADAGIPIDVLPIRYERDGEVMLERLIAPSDIRPGDAVDLRVVLRSQDAARGQLTLFRNGVRVPMGQGNTLDVRLEPGLTVVPLRAPASGGAMERYEVTFEPDVSTKDARATNNSASAVSLNAGQGLVLLVSDDGLGLERLAALLRRRGMSVEA